jgi:NADP-dependent 3-hydroxy acid dehydrogenase YdfG
MERGLEGRLAVVTGASSGIGEAVARALAGEGATVALLARRKDRLDRLASELQSKGAEARAYEVDVTDEEAVRDVAERVRGDLGRADCLVNNAGQMLLGLFAEQDPDEWRRMIDLNVTGVLETTKAFLDQLTDGGGDLVNISSVAGRRARPTTSAYNATKWGMNGWSEALRVELLPHRVRVIVVEPGMVRTELADHITDEQLREGMRTKWDEIEALTPEDVAASVVFAVSQPERVSLNEILIRPTGQEY